jgi:DNA (cytosine-5)-methyltransferase 3A
VQNGIVTVNDKQYSIPLQDGYYIIRKLTVNECKRLQTVPAYYELPVSDSRAYRLLGNGWTVDVISHIMSHFDGITDESLEVLSMYDGMSCARIALEKLGATIERYYATEVEANAIKTTLHNFSDTIELGDAYQVRDDDFLEKLKDLPV